MIELRQAVPHHDLLRHAVARQALALEGVDIGRRGRLGVQVHVDEGRGQIADRGIALVECLGRLHLVDQRLRHGLAGLVVLHEAVEDRPAQHPVLMHLRRIFDIVARRAAQRRIGHLRRIGVQGVAELVEQGLGVVERDQDRLGALGLDEIVVVRAEGVLLAVIGRMRPVGRHPGPGPLAGAGIVVGIVEADRPTRVLDLIDGDVRVEDRHGARGQFFEGEAVQAARHLERTGPDVVELEIGFQLVLIEVVLLLPDLLRIVEVVPRLDVVAGDGAHVGDFFRHPRLGRGPDAVHQIHGRARGLRHRVLHPPFGVVAEAQQTGAVLTQLHDLGDGRIGVVAVAVVAAVDEFAPDHFAQAAIVGEAEEGIDARAGVYDGPALHIARTGGRGGRGLVRGRQAGHAGFGRDDRPGVFVGHDLLAEAGEGVGQGGVDPAQFGLAGGVQRGAIAHEAVAAAGRNPGLFGGQAGSLGAVGDGLDAREQALVEGDLVAGRRQQGRQFGVDLIVVVRADIRGHDAIDGAGPVQRFAGHLQGDQGVGEGGGFGIVGDRRDLGALQLDAFQHGGAQLGGGHTIPRRGAAVRTGPGLQQLGARRLRRQDGAGDGGVRGEGGGRRASAHGHAVGSAGRQGEQAASGDEKLASVHGVTPSVWVLWRTVGPSRPDCHMNGP